MSEANFITRPLTMQDADEYVNTVNAVSAHIGNNDRLQALAVLLDWQEPGFDLSSASVGIFASGGRLAGYAIFWATSETPVRPGLSWGVHPDFQDDKLEAKLLRWGLQQGQEAISRCPPEARVSLGSGAQDGDTFAERALTGAGFSQCRSFYDMEIQLTEAPPRPSFPEGISLRPYRHDTDLPTLTEVIRDAFSDHYGFVEEPFEKELEQFRHWLHNNPFYDPALVQFPVAEDSGEVAGCLIGLTQDHLNPHAGYVDAVGVRRAYRQRGLATAMLQHSFAQFWERGTTTVRLDVDGESLTNAVALYERVGMRVVRQFNVYEKVLREGVELAKVALE